MSTTATISVDIWFVQQCSAQAAFNLLWLQSSLAADSPCHWLTELEHRKKVTHELSSWFCCFWEYQNCNAQTSRVVSLWRIWSRFWRLTQVSKQMFHVTRAWSLANKDAENCSLQASQMSWKQNGRGITCSNKDDSIARVVMLCLLIDLTWLSWPPVFQRSCRNLLSGWWIWAVIDSPTIPLSCTDRHKTKGSLVQRWKQWCETTTASAET